MTATLDRITIFPMKALDGVDLSQTQVLTNGALENDRRFALVDAEGRFVHGKRTAAIHRIRAEFDLARMTVRLNGTSEFSLLQEKTELGQWFTAALGVACEVTENTAGGFPDDTTAPGPTVVSTATLQEIANWFPGLTVDETRRRFRANLEIAGVEPFWEDQLFGPTGVEEPFQIGEVTWLGVYPCQRCVVPTRASTDGEPTPGFQKTFAQRRENSLPGWAPRDHFNHFYRLTVNTRLAPGQSSQSVRVGDVLTLAPRGSIA